MTVEPKCNSSSLTSRRQGEVGKAVAKLFQREPSVQARHDLKRLKMLMETGEIATSARQRENTRAAQQENN